MDDDLTPRPALSPREAAMEWFHGPASAPPLERTSRRTFLLATLVALICLPLAPASTEVGVASWPFIVLHVVAGTTACFGSASYLYLSRPDADGNVRGPATAVLLVTIYYPLFSLFALPAVL